LIRGKKMAAKNIYKILIESKKKKKKRKKRPGTISSHVRASDMNHTIVKR
jgi:hypothetical protein